MSIKCEKCIKYDLSFHATHINPVDYIEGSRSSDIWIIGLNPKGPLRHIEVRTIEQFENFRPNSNDKKHSYFHDFKKVSPKLYANYESFENSRVAHTDIVKCFSNNFPPSIAKNGKRVSDKDLIIENCSEHLFQQLLKYKPKVIICNGSPVSREILKMFNPSTEENWNSITSYEATLRDTGYKFWVILSGFLGRIDDRNKRRLGKEIEEILKNLNIEL